LHHSACWTVRDSRSRRVRQRRQRFGDQNGQIEHPQADRYREQPRVQLSGDPVEADQMVLHPRNLMLIRRYGQDRPVMLRRNIKTGKRLLNYA
jgi:hypothetical protein